MRPEEIPLRQRASLYEYREPAGVVPARRMDLSCKLGAGAFYATLLANMEGRDWIHDEAAAIARLFVAARSGVFQGPGAPDAGASDVREETDAAGEEADQAHGETAAEAETTIALVGASILPMDRDTLLSNQVVVISDGRIREVTDAADAVIPRDARRFDLQGLYLMPGLVDSHTHAGDPFLPLYLTGRPPPARSLPAPADGAGAKAPRGGRKNQVHGALEDAIGAGS